MKQALRSAAAFFLLAAMVGVVRAEDAPAIRLNTLGYLPGAPKQATVAVPCATFAVVRAADGERVLEGTATGPVRNADTDEQLFTADFSELAEPGEYQLDVAGVGKSAPFRVASDLYREPFLLVTRGMYLWRCGCPVHGEHDGQTYEHAACHVEDGFLDFVDERAGASSPPGAGVAHGGAESPSPGPSHQGRGGSNEDSHQGRGDNPGSRRDGTKGWHDAGDYNKYVVNAGVTVGCMLRAWEDFRPQVEAVALGNQGGVGSRESGVGKAGDGKNLPDSRILAPGSLPDFLAELKWETDWLLTMQAPDGSVYHKLSAINFSAFELPEDEKEPRYFVPWGSAATADFVAMLAAASRSFRPYDPAYADRCLAAARKSYAFLQAHPEDHQPDQSAFHTGGYGGPDWDDRLWAAAEMWEATGDAAALADFETRARAAEPQRRRWWRSRDNDDEDDEGNRPTVYQWHVAADWDWGNTKNLGLLTYLFSERPGRDAELVDMVRGSVIDTADRIVETRDNHGYARPLGNRYYWGCNGTVARQVLVLEAARRVVRQPFQADEGGRGELEAGARQAGKPDVRGKYKAASLDALNHLLGRNVYGRSFVTGLGDRPPLHPHDRRSGADQNADPWPGYLVGGPHPGAKDWHDEEADYRTNEIAINWNGALIYALAAAMEDGQ